MMKNCIQIKKSEACNFWFVMASTDTQVKYLHKSGTWKDSCFNHVLDKDEDGYLNDILQGHYETKEEAIAAVKKYTRFTLIYDENEQEMRI